MVIARGLQGSSGVAVGQVANGAFMQGMSVAMTIGAIVVGVASVVLFAWLPARAAPLEDQESTSTSLQATGDPASV